MKTLLKSLVLATAVALGAGSALADDLPIKFTLDWKAQGPHAWFYLAQQKGYFKAEGLDVTVDQGEGSSAAVTRVISGAYDAGFGDINAVIRAAAKAPDEAPVMVYLVYNGAPFAIISKKDGPVQALKDLEGKTVAAPTGSATYQLFPALAEANGFDAGKVNLLNASQNLIEQMLVRGQADAIAQFGQTSYMNFIAMGLDPNKDFNWFYYSAHGLDLYSNGVIVSRKLIKEHPEAVKGLVAAINKAIMDVVANPAEGIDAIVKVEPLTDRKLETERLKYTIDNQLRTAETAKIGLGDLDMGRLQHSIEMNGKLEGMASLPKASAIFDPQFLPEKSVRLLPAAN
ncbi:ABC transporter substrate-binding protein [Radicibacter daui]|uniref:ABC transporter substrate-binding protein n=1 Tax=Radicibacter daui TaxID=3064829 RepID=UPI004046F74B